MKYGTVILQGNSSQQMLNMRKIFAILNILALNGGNREMIN
jgi:hypothetical protein